MIIYFLTCIHNFIDFHEHYIASVTVESLSHLSRAHREPSRGPRFCLQMSLFGAKVQLESNSFLYTKRKTFNENKN